LVLRADLGEEKGTMLAERRGGARGRGDARADGIARRRLGGGVYGAIRAGARVPGVERDVEQGMVKREARRSSRFAGGKCEVKRHVCCQTIRRWRVSGG
jgi:hypothetical protein